MLQGCLLTCLPDQLLTNTFCSEPSMLTMRLCCPATDQYYNLLAGGIQKTRRVEVRKKKKIDQWRQRFLTLLLRSKHCTSPMVFFFY
uniref:Uncharacterized protein n=1 Tax=Anopheles albimanus TaxID=7167 RepID=A0A182FYJ9_ANOAL